MKRPPCREREHERYDYIGTSYSSHRRPDWRIAKIIDSALLDAVSVVDIGSGTGSYEPKRRRVVAVEPSRTMISQRPSHAATVLQGIAERLPFPDLAFDAALAVLTLHHWSDASKGLSEMGRVARRQVILTWDPAVFARFWFVREYLPDLATADARKATLEAVSSALNVTAIFPVLVPSDCTDGFGGAYWRRPACYLDPGARRAISGFSLCREEAVNRALTRLAADLESGLWAERHQALCTLKELDVGYRLIVASGKRK